MKHTITILSMLFAISSFGQSNQMDTAIFNPSPVAKKESGYVLVAPKKSEWKVVAPNATKGTIQLAGVEEDSIAYQMQRIDPNQNLNEFQQAERALENGQIPTDYQNKRDFNTLSTQALTYDQVRALQTLPYLK